MNNVRRLFNANGSAGSGSTTTTTAVSTQSLVNGAAGTSDGTSAWTPIIIGRQATERSSQDNEQPLLLSNDSLKPTPQSSVPPLFFKMRPTESPDPISPSSDSRDAISAPSTSTRTGNIANGVKQKSIPRKPHHDLILELLATESALECKDFEQLEHDEIEALKKEQSLLSSRLEAVVRKLKIESRIRDATRSFDKAKKNNPLQASFDSSNEKVDAMQKDLLRLKEQSFVIQKRLLQHHCSILSAKIRDSHRPPGGQDFTRKGSVSSIRSIDNRRNLRGKFGPSHLYANHSGATVPKGAKAAEERIQQLGDEVDMLKRKHADKCQELQHLQSKATERETALQTEIDSTSVELAHLRQDAGRLAGLQGQVDELMEERENWEEEMQNLRNLLEDKLQRITDLQSQLEIGKESESRNRELQHQRSKWEAERQELMAQLEGESQRWEEERRDVESRINEQAEKLDRELTIRRQEWNEVSDVLRGSAEKHRIEVEDGSALTIAKALTGHLNQVVNEAETLRRTRGDSGFPVKLTGAKRSLSVSDESWEFQLRTLWATLPSPEARGLKLGGRNKVTASPISANGANGSLSELDVRSLRSLYENKKGGKAITPSGDFTIEGFVQRVHALIADDKALIERLIRFAQGHELLRANAERAQKLARESSQALEVYQKQVKALQERTDDSDGTQTSLVEQLAEAARATERLRSEKQELENRNAKQAIQLATLTTANDALTAKATAQSTSANAAMEEQLDELRQALKKAEDEIESMRNSEVAQQLQKATLLDELNTMQNDNSRLREQLRAKK